MKQLLLPAALALGLVQCKHADPTPAPPVDPLTLLPAETSSGAGTFGCLVNGQAMSVKSGFSAQGDWDGPSSFRLLGATSATQPDYAAQILLVGQLEGKQTFAL
ncbi:MAG: hypothetical protein EOO62_33665 [Hymenobacter sp.]|nr:MAG: hypothetical protein EOO62_33665 [Hymenobacter sp.]